MSSSTFKIYMKTPPQRDLTSKYAQFKTIQDFGYTYNSSGYLVATDSKQQYFKFIDQTHYDFLNDAVQRYIQQKLVSDYGMVETWLNTNLSKDKRVNIFHTPNAFSSNGTLLILITGSGPIRAGCWASSLCINGPERNGGLEKGSMFPFIERAQKRGFEILILNPSFNFTIHNEPIPNHESPLDHALYVYDHFIAKSKAKNIVIVGHSFAGVTVLSGFLLQRKEILSRLKCCAFADAVHTTMQLQGLSDEALQFLKTRCKNWIMSIQALDKSEGTKAGTPCVSAGTTVHTLAPYCAMESIFKFIDELLKK